ncbi:autotransporter outer membrane beta-barrel domain-containing protein [Bartonella vinsonii]|uniref:autotransporter family protein n=1 Tax=Bartonella vinsonii TaxID=33047 RepID=UPI0002B6D92B|nr:autotransporter outer membrane beta-barrel domain-containing protein [Bartonella vinsonii]AGF76289.1 Inducible Bartonella autotransporter [Bartonella vinsonii subsp. berkhoffii str. Winnie]
MYKKKFLLCTIAGTFLLSSFNSAYANTPPSEIKKVDVQEGEKTFNNVIIRDRISTVNAKGSKTVVTIKKAEMTSEMVSFNATKGGRINAKDVNAKTLIKGLEIANGVINLEDSMVTVKGNHESYGINFGFITKFVKNDGEEVVNQAILTNTKLLVKDGIGILGPFSNGEIRLQNSEIRADILLQNKTMPGTDPVTLKLIADGSFLEGRAKTLPTNTTIFTLNNNSKWYLKISQNEVDNDDITKLLNYALLDINQRAQSSISVLNLNDSSIIFDKPNAVTEYRYQTLHIGQQPQAEKPQSPRNQESNGATAVYNASGKAEIYFNTQWSNGAESADQKTDRLLVHGDVSGTTTIHFNNLLSDENTQAEDSIPLNTRGLSLVQVSGKAEENAFKLANGYTTMGSMPYKYTLIAYGPTANRGKANTAQNLLGKNENFWDFRLQSATLDPEEKIRALVPQVASYLVMPSALFSTGLADVNNQNTLLDNMRTSAVELEMRKNKGIFFSSYRKKSTFFSSRKPSQYGYGADIRYAALQAGVTLAAIEEQDTITNFGLLGTYGKLAFTPKDMEGSEKSTLDKFSLAAYGSLHHSNGMYVNALFSYGALKGNITTALIGNTAKLDHTKTWSASATIGQRLATGTEGLVFEPQAQLVYQRLMLGTFSDIDGFDVNMGNPHQWLGRVGGRLTQMVIPADKDYALSFYGKLNAMKAFGDNGTIQVGDTFHLDSAESSIEGGLGVNAQLSQNIALHADVSYQHKLQRAGFSGINVSGGLRYQF